MSWMKNYAACREELEQWTEETTLGHDAKDKWSLLVHMATELKADHDGTDEARKELKVADLHLASYYEPTMERYYS